MKITICGSIAFIEEIVAMKERLEKLGHEVKIPLTEIEGEDGEMISASAYYKMRKASEETEGWIWDKKENAIRTHFEKIVWSDAILVLNYDKNSIANYIGANTFLEMGVAFHEGKPIYTLNALPDIDCKEELLGMKPIVLAGDISKLTLG